MLTSKPSIIALLGSTKQDSINKTILGYVTDQVSDDYSLEIFDISTLPFFNPDLDQENSLPSSVQSFRKALEDAQGVLVSSPEYVFSVSGILKNAIEWVVSTMVFHEKPTAVITASSSGEKAHESLQLILKTIGAHIEDHAAVLIQSPKTKFNEAGLPTDAQTERALKDLIQNFTASIQAKVPKN
jgi:chromate reductase, NAD(P)H dehydrogenase (quinone)